MMKAKPPIPDGFWVTEEKFDKDGNIISRQLVPTVPELMYRCGIYTCPNLSEYQHVETGRLICEYHCKQLDDSTKFLSVRLKTTENRGRKKKE